MMLRDYASHPSTNLAIHFQNQSAMKNLTSFKSMKKRYKALLALAAAIVLLAAYILIAGSRTFDAPYPDITASTDPAVIARGEYLVYGPAHCLDCHAPKDKLDALFAGGPKPALVGGWEFPIPPGTLRAPNITPDEETGIGRLSDAQIARSLRYGVNHKGGYIMPVMPFSQMSDADLQAIISYLRVQPAVRQERRKTEYSFLGKALLAFGVLQPKAPAAPAPKTNPMDSPIAYGEYLAHNVANCMTCHTEMNLMTGEFIGEPFAGGFYFEPDAYSQGYHFVSPNLTPDKTTGIISSWDEATFIRRFQAGRIHAGSAMPWEAFANMDSTDLSAIYQYLQSLKPVARKIPQIVYEPGEAYK
jgi:mono/diheme cytochrome c family protein